MTMIGIYRSRSANGIEFAHIRDGRPTGEEVTRALYEANGYEPPFDRLPTQEQYEKAKPKNADGGSVAPPRVE